VIKQLGMKGRRGTDFKTDPYFFFSLERIN
jgi:hypothetical protein